MQGTDEAGGQRFRTAIIDPPWPYQRTSGHGKLTGYSDQQYQPLSIDDLADLPVGDVVGDYVFLWTTSPMIPSAVRLVDAWGFQFRTMLYWHKSSTVPERVGRDVVYRPAFGVGYWFRGDTEPIVLATRKGAPAIRTNERATFITKRTQHSAKPEVLHNLVERHFPGPYLEVFARSPRGGWTGLGDELMGDGRDVRESLAAMVTA